MKCCFDINKYFILVFGIKVNILINVFKYLLVIGNWGDQKKVMSFMVGVLQVLNCYIFVFMLFYLRCINMFIGCDGKFVKFRQFYNIYWGLVCLVEMFEGQVCGLVKNLFLMCYVSVGILVDLIVDFMMVCGMDVLEEYELFCVFNVIKVFVNGIWVGVYNDFK